MSALEWALLLQIIYFLGIMFVTRKRSSWSESDAEHQVIREYRYRKMWETELFIFEASTYYWFNGAIWGAWPFLPLFLTILSLFLYPTAWVFIWLALNILWNLWLGVGLKEKEPTNVIASLIGFFILLVNLKIVRKSTEPVTSNAVSTLQTTDENVWLLPLKVLIALASMIGVLLLIYWVLRELFPDLDSGKVLEQILIAVISGIMMTSATYLLFGDPTTATVPGLLVATGIYFLNNRQS